MLVEPFAMIRRFPTWLWCCVDSGHGKGSLEVSREKKDQGERVLQLFHKYGKPIYGEEAVFAVNMFHMHMLYFRPFAGYNTQTKQPGKSCVQSGHTARQIGGETLFGDFVTQFRTCIIKHSQSLRSKIKIVIELSRKHCWSWSSGADTQASSFVSPKASSFWDTSMPAVRATQFLHSPFAIRHSSNFGLKIDYMRSRVWEH